MPFKLRLEFPGATYHVINRGNYRRWIFETTGAQAAFEACLFAACRRCDWVLHAFVIMSNHFHLALATPRGNLVAGMQWLESTLAKGRSNLLLRLLEHLTDDSVLSIKVVTLTLAPDRAQAHASVRLDQTHQDTIDRIAPKLPQVILRDKVPALIGHVFPRARLGHPDRKFNSRVVGAEPQPRKLAAQPAVKR